MVDADVIITGAGPAGLMTAMSLAAAGRRVVVFEKKSRDLIGKPIRVSLEKRVFSEVGLAPPEPPELIAPPLARELLSPDRNFKLRLRELPLVTVDLRAFLSRLAAEAEAAGAELMFETNITGPVLTAGRVTGVVGSDAQGRLLELTAPLSIDASGIFGALRHRLDESMGVEIEISPRDVANAWQESREIDREAVMELLSKNRIRPQIAVLRVGIMGPYSMFGVYVDMDNDRVEVTVGLLHDEAYPTARELAERYGSSHHWIGEPIAAAGGLIPVRRPLDSFIAHGFACVGDAACQAIPQHASGVTSALIGGKILAGVADAALERGDTSRDALWPYNARYMQARGAAQANSDLFRRFLIGLTTDELSALFSRGLITEEAIVGSLDGMALELPRAAVFTAALGLLGRPGLLSRLWRLSRDSLRVLDVYNSYPEEYDHAGFKRWREQAARIFNKWDISAPPAREPKEGELTEPTVSEK
ncbi:MAG TPA: NAD(P)/FAD-dependent oxidoreductase [bacterium]|nr:NAD(P)/FAD-dependent oxidoreductase [bacterium]